MSPVPWRRAEAAEEVSLKPAYFGFGQRRLGLKAQAQSSNRLKPIPFSQLILDTPY